MTKLMHNCDREISPLFRMINNEKTMEYNYHRIYHRDIKNSIKTCMPVYLLRNQPKKKKENHTY